MGGIASLIKSGKNYGGRKGPKIGLFWAITRAEIPGVEYFEKV
jgi:hypothetical protein